ncbi:MAG: NAD(P)H-dependent oxidoreductase subunit E [Saprospiraceae bacterium]|nr:NAD(P)H-dependent oxidoreductase subunit E [Saprospiraceae bacterium]
MSKNLSELSGRKDLDKILFNKIGEIASKTGTPDQESMKQLAEEYLMGNANIYGTVSFYDFTRPENKGKKVYVCNGTACLCAGTQKTLKEKLSTQFDKSEIGEMCCLGRCHENHAFHYEGLNYSGDAIESLKDKKIEPGKNLDQYQTGNFGTPVLNLPFEDPKIIKETLAKAVFATPESLIEELKISGLRGRGGAGFPISFKLESCKNTTGDKKFIVCNADEGDPGAYSDRYIMEQKPYALLLGMMVAGYITGADSGIVYIRAEYPESITIIDEAIKNLNNLGLLGENILESGFNFQFKVVKAQGAYICGEETALLSSIEGQRPEVRTRPPFPTQQGLFNKPTVVNNVETLANIPFIVQNGGNAFAKIGKGKSTGTKLVSLDSHFKNPGIYEVDMGTPLKEVIHNLGGGFTKPIKAMHIGGPLGGLVPVQKINDLTVDFESFSQNGFLLGHASVVCIPVDFPIIQYLEHLFQFTAHESCGKCFPCRLGSTRGYELLNKARTTDLKMDRNLLDDLLDTLERGSLCALGGGLPLPVKNALHYFEDELREYFY